MATPEIPGRTVLSTDPSLLTAPVLEVSLGPSGKCISTTNSRWVDFVNCPRASEPQPSTTLRPFPSLRSPRPQQTATLQSPTRKPNSPARFESSPTPAETPHTTSRRDRAASRPTSMMYTHQSMDFDREHHIEELRPVFRWAGRQN